ncbi:MAG: DUF393 domain-containing protein [Planctomycetota bacterium]
MDILFYDGDCGLCHLTVRFVANHDRAGRFAFSPLDGERIRQRLSDAQRAALPDSVVVLRAADGAVLTRSAASAYVLSRLPGVWPTLGAAIAVLPRVVADLGYDAIARVRKKLFPKPAGVCPVLPEALRVRFRP